MKKIKLNTMQRGDRSSMLTREKRHCISLGNGYSVYFKNINNAKTYLAKTNRFMNMKILELNKIYIDLWSEYRHLKVIYHHGFYKESRIVECIRTIERNSDLLLERSSWANGNHFSFKYFYLIIESLQAFTDILKTILKARNQYYTVQNIDVLVQRVEFAKMTLDDWGKELQKDTPACFYDNTSTALSEQN